MTMSLICLALMGSSLLSVAAAQSTLSVQISGTPPSGASQPVNPSFAGFGIEPSNLFSFAGYDTPNQLSINLLQNLANYTGSPPHIRLGGNTQDYMYYSASMTQWTWINNPDSDGTFTANSMLIGPRFYEAANRFPAGTPMTYGLNMAYQESDYVTQITTMAQQAVNTFTNVNLVSLEIGNEPDLYLSNGLRTGSWDGTVYTSQWLDRAYWVYSKVLKGAGISSNFFEAAQTASTIGTSFTIKDLYADGIAKNANGTGKPYLYSWNQHDYYYYIGVSTYPLTLLHFMTLSTTKDQFAAWVEQIGEAAATPFPYALREMGVVGPIGMDGITNVFGAALWTLNFLLYTATLNISSVELFMTDNSNASAWLPISMYGLQPFVRPNYYGIAAFDQIIGPSCQATVYNNPIDAPGDYGGRLETYSIYQDNTLASIVIINSNIVNASTADKPTLNVQLSLPTEFAGKDLYLALLTNEGADSKTGTMWNGISFEQSSDGTPTQVSDVYSSVKIGDDGSASFTVRDTQAVVANIGSPVGQVKANSSACSSMGATGTKRSSTTSSNAASSLKGSSAHASPTNGMIRVSSMILLTVVSSLITGAFLILA